MDDLVAWLTVQLDIDKREQSSRFVDTWKPGDPCTECGRPAEEMTLMSGLPCAEFRPCGHAVFDASRLNRYWQPASDARVLREIDAKRRVLARHHAAPVPPGSEWAAEFPYCAAHAYPGHDGSTVYPVELKDCPELRDLASNYAGRPGYREEWRP